MTAATTIWREIERDDVSRLLTSDPTRGPLILQEGRVALHEVAGAIAVRIDGAWRELHDGWILASNPSNNNLLLGLSQPPESNNKTR